MRVLTDFSTKPNSFVLYTLTAFVNASIWLSLLAGLVGGGLLVSGSKPPLLVLFAFIGIIGFIAFMHWSYRHTIEPEIRKRLGVSDETLTLHSK